MRIPSTGNETGKAAVILVTGATGAQGGAVAKHLLAAGQRVRFLTRDPETETAQRLIAAGADACRGSFDDAASVRSAVTGSCAVFSMQNAVPDEVTHGNLLVREALHAGVRQFVHTSVCGTTECESFPDWGTGRWAEGYWTAKWSVEESVRHAGFRLYTVLRPAFLMENFLPPKVQHMFPSLRRGKIASTLCADTRLQLISADDIGRYAAAAILDPERFAGRSLDLAAESPTVGQIAATLSDQLQRSVRVEELTPDQAIASGLSPGWVRSQEWTNAHGYRASLDALKPFGVKPTSFANWVKENRKRFLFD